MSEFEQGTPKPPGSMNPTEAPDGAEPGSQLPLWPPKAGEAPSAELHPDIASFIAETAVEPAYPAWSLADLGMFVLFVGVVSLPVAYLAVVGVFLGLRGIFGWEMTVAEAFMHAPMVVSLQTGWEVLWLGFLYFTIAVKYRQRFWEAIRWTRGVARPRMWLAAGAVMALLAQLIFYLSPTENELPIERLFTSPEAGYVLAVFGIGVAPFVEELVFRGFFYPVFERRWGLGPAVLLTAVLFAVIHAAQLWGGWQELAAIFIVGLVFSYSRGRTGSLVPSYLMHLGYNAALFVSLYFSTDGFQKLQG